MSIYIPYYKPNKEFMQTSIAKIVDMIKTGLISTFGISDYPVWEKIYGSGVWGPLETENNSSKKNLKSRNLVEKNTFSLNFVTLLVLGI